MSSVPSDHTQRLPEELLERILYSTAYDDNDFRTSSFEYDDSSIPGSPFSIRHSQFASLCLLVNKRFLRVGLPLLWMYVVVRSMRQLQSITRQVRLGTSLFPPKTISLSTRRLNLSITEQYEPRLVDEIVRYMPRLSIFISNNSPHVLRRCPHEAPSPLAVALARLSDLRRVQFCSMEEPPCYCDIRCLLQTQAPLTSLRIETLDTPRSYPPLNPVHVHHATFLLRQLSFGVTGEDGRDMFAGPGLEALLAAFLSPRVDMPNLRKVHMLQYSPLNIPFLQAHGSLLRDLIYSTPPQDDLSCDRDMPFLDLCPILRSLVWVIGEWRCVKGAHSFASEHNSLAVLTVVYPVMETPSPYSHDHVQNLLDHIERSSFPNLSVINLKPGGDSEPDPHLEALTWFRARRRSFKRRGTTLRAVAD